MYTDTYSDTYGSISTLTGPTWVRNEAHGGRAAQSLFGRMKYLHVGYGIIRDAAGGYTQVTDADDDDIKFSTAYYMGGHSYQLTTAEVSDLTNAGYGSYITTI